MRMASPRPASPGFQHVATRRARAAIAGCDWRAISSLGVTVNTFTPAITAGLIGDVHLFAKGGKALSASSAGGLETNAFQSSADFGWVFQIGDKGRGPR